MLAWARRMPDEGGSDCHPSGMSKPRPAPSLGAPPLGMVPRDEIGPGTSPDGWAGTVLSAAGAWAASLAAGASPRSPQAQRLKRRMGSAFRIIVGLLEAQIIPQISGRLG